MKTFQNSKPWILSPETLVQRDDVMAMGIKAYNAECRSIVMKYADEWKRVVRRMARWIDMENDYKTLDINYMESVWWVCKQLFDKDLIYR